ncbi:MAG: MBL fold metallo-hydrolase [Ruminococcaceae bacterium]|nr:MBL fold metallo-hydrolase [Oscillospiraceae bacterium]
MREKILQTALAEGQVALYYLGQVGFLIKWQEKYLLIDGYLSDYVDKNCSSELVHWVRKYPAPIQAASLDFVDYVFCTHTHFDHADPETLATLARVNKKAKYIVSAANVDTIAAYGIEKSAILGLAADRETVLGEGIAVTAIPAAHEVFHTDANGHYREVGFRISLGDITLFHAGDGCPYEGLAERLRGCDILFLPINGRDYYRTVICDIIGCFDSREAVLLAKEIGARLLIPTHFDLYEVNGVNPAHFVDTLKTLHPAQSFHIFAPGERFLFAK